MNKNLISLCQQLQLSTMASRVNKALEQAIRQQLSYEDFLADLLSGECDTRAQRRFTKRVKEARFPGPKTLDNFSCKCSHPPIYLLN